MLLWLLQLLSLILIVSLIPLHSAAVAHQQPPDPTPWHEGGFVYAGDALVKPGGDPVEQKRLDEAATPQLPLAKNKPRARKPAAPVNPVLCLCLSYLRQKTGDQRLIGYLRARDVKIESKKPFPHGFVITYESGNGHIAEYFLNEQSQTQVIDEANYSRCRTSSGRIVSPAVIKGFLALP